MTMLTFEEATERVTRAAWTLPVEKTPLSQALGRVLAEDICSDVDVPPFNKSAMDGYACRAEDARDLLQVLEHIPAGRMPVHPLSPGTCSKVMTGAPVPDGADCVLIVEEVEEVGANSVRFTGQETKRNICPAGDDVRRGDRVLRAGLRLEAKHLPVLAAAGCGMPSVHRQPTVGIMATGDELVLPDETPGPGKIRNSNSVQLSALAQRAGAVVTDLGIVSDDVTALRKAWEQALASYDIVLSTGGVSMGDFDLIPDVIQHFGFDVHFERVAIQPGKPIQFATRNTQACFALSGNPVSSFLQFTLFVEPFLHVLQGAEFHHRRLPLMLGETFTRRNAGRMGWIPIRVDRDGQVRPLEFHGSAHINALTEADGLIAFPVGIETLDAGTPAEVLFL